LGELFDSSPALFRCFGDNLARHFRHVLVDSRTGRTDSAGICTTLLPRKLVVVFTPNRQSLEGVQALVTRATAYRRSHEDEQRPLVVYPLPSRIEMGDSVQRAQWRRGDTQQRILGYQTIFERLMRDCYGVQHISLDSYFDEVQLQQTRTFAYGEQLAVRLDQGGDRFSLTRTFEALLDWLGPGYFPWQSSREIHLLSDIGEARRALDEGGGGVGPSALTQPLARDLNLLGEMYRRENKLRQALACFEESLILRQRGAGEDHPDTLISKSHLAEALRLQDRLDEAQFLEECVVEARERLLGPEHLDTLAARANLAATLAQQGRTAEALGMQDNVLDAYLRLLGSDHLLTLACKAARASGCWAPNMPTPCAARPRWPARWSGCRSWTRRAACWTPCCRRRSAVSAPIIRNPTRRVSSLPMSRCNLATRWAPHWDRDRWCRSCIRTRQWTITAMRCRAPRERAVWPGPAACGRGPAMNYWRKTASWPARGRHSGSAPAQRLRKLICLEGGRHAQPGRCFR
jgi:tetratricopeptide (TPR) repeat protein